MYELSLDAVPFPEQSTSLHCLNCEGRALAPSLAVLRVIPKVGDPVTGVPFIWHYCFSCRTNWCPGSEPNGVVAHERVDDWAEGKMLLRNGEVKFSLLRACKHPECVKRNQDIYGFLKTWQTDPLSERSMQLVRAIEAGLAQSPLRAHAVKLVRLRHLLAVHELLAAERRFELAERAAREAERAQKVSVRSGETVEDIMTGPEFADLDEVGA